MSLHKDICMSTFINRWLQTLHCSKIHVYLHTWMTSNIAVHKNTCTSTYMNNFKHCISQRYMYIYLHGWLEYCYKYYWNFTFCKTKCKKNNGRLRCMSLKQTYYFSAIEEHKHKDASLEHPEKFTLQTSWYSILSHALYNCIDARV